MEIQNDTVVTLHCELYDLNDQCLDSGNRALVYLHGGYDSVFPALEGALTGHRVGDSVSIILEPEDAYGDLEVQLVIQESLTALPKNINVGSIVTGGPRPLFDDDPVAYRVISIDGDTVLLDGNHPLAGKTLRVSCRIDDIRYATPEEIAARTPGTDKG